MSTKYSHASKEYMRRHKFEQVYIPKASNANSLTNNEPKPEEKVNSGLRQGEKHPENGSNNKQYEPKKVHKAHNEYHASKKDIKSLIKENEDPKNRDIKGPRSRNIMTGQTSQIKSKKESAKVEYVEKSSTPSSKKIKLLSQDPSLFSKEKQVAIYEILSKKANLSSEGSTDSKATDTTDKSSEARNINEKSDRYVKKQTILEEEKPLKDPISLDLFTEYLPSKNEEHQTLEKLDLETVEEKVDKDENMDEDNEIDHNQIFALRIISRGYSRPAIEVETKPTAGFSSFRNVPSQNRKSPMTSVQSVLSIVPEQMDANYITTQSAYLPAYNYENSACNVIQNGNRAEDSNLPNIYIPFPQSAVGLEYDTDSLFDDSITNISTMGEVNPSNRMSPTSVKNTPASKRLTAFTQHEQIIKPDPEFPPGKLQVGGIVFNMHPKRLNSNSMQQESKPMMNSRINGTNNIINENIAKRSSNQKPFRRNNEAITTLGRLQEATKINHLNQFQDFAWKTVLIEEGI